MEDGYGFGYFRDDNGRLVRKPNNCGVWISDNVEIGKFTCIDKGSYRNTEIGWGTKIDNLVHIAHNVIIGQHCLIVAGAVVAGSVVIGNHSYVGAGAVIKEHVKIGEQVIIGAGSVVINDVPDRDIVAGNPAKSIKHKVKLDDKARYNMVGY